MAAARQNTWSVISHSASATDQIFLLMEGIERFSLCNICLYSFMIIFIYIFLIVLLSVCT